MVLLVAGFNLCVFLSVAWVDVLSVRVGAVCLVFVLAALYQDHMATLTATKVRLRVK